MAVQTRISLTTLQCFKQQELVDDEPYLWTAYFKLDGDTAVLDLIGDRPDAELGAQDCFIRGSFTLVTTQGDQDDLGTDMETGDTVGIPTGLGAAGFTINPIPVTPRAQSKLGVGFVSGAVGYAAALMEEDRTTHAAAAQGHLAFNRSLVTEINGLVYQDGGPTSPDDLKGKLGFTNNKGPTDEQIAAIKRNVFAAVEAAIKAAGGPLLDNDESLGTAHDFVLVDDLVKLGTQAISEPLIQFENGAIESHYQLSGEFLGIDGGAMDYSWFQRSEEFGTAAAAGVPSTFLFAGKGVADIVYRDTSGGLWELWRHVTGITGHRNVTLLTGATPAAGNPVAYADTDRGQVVVAYRDAGSGHIHTAYWLGADTGHENLTGPAGAPPAAGNPAALFVPDTATHHVIYRSGDGHLHVVWWQGGDPAGHDDITALSAAPKAAGDVSPYYATTSREHLMVFRGTDGHIHDIHWRVETPAQHEDLSAVAGTPQAAGDPVAYHIPSLDLHQFTYLAVDGRLYEIYCFGDQAVQGWDLLLAAGAPDAVVTSDPVAYYHAPTNTKHVVYREADGHLYDLQWIPNVSNPRRIDLTLLGLADGSAGKPAACIGLGNDQSVVYRSADNQIHEILMHLP